MDSQLFRLLAGISTATIVLPVIIYIVRFKAQPKQNHFIGILLITSFAVDGLMWFLVSKERSTIAFNNTYIIMSFLLITAFYYEVLFSKRIKYVMPLCLLLFLIVVLSTVFDGGLMKVNSNMWAFTSFIVAIYSLLYVCIIPSMIIDRFLDRFLYSNVIISSSLSLYALTALLIFLLSDFVFTHLTANESRIFWTFHNIVNILKNFGIAIGLFLSGKRKTYITLEQLEKMGKPQISDL